MVEFEKKVAWSFVFFSMVGIVLAVILWNVNSRIDKLEQLKLPELTLILKSNADTVWLENPYWEVRQDTTLQKPAVKDSSFLYFTEVNLDGEITEDWIRIPRRVVATAIIKQSANHYRIYPVGYGRAFQYGFWVKENPLSLLESQEAGQEGGGK